MPVRYQGGPLDGCYERPKVYYPGIKVWPSPSDPDGHALIYRLNAARDTYVFDKEVAYTDEAAVVDGAAEFLRQQDPEG